MSQPEKEVWGVVQELVVEADTDEALLYAIRIMMTYRNTFTHYTVTTAQNPKPGEAVHKLILDRHGAGPSTTLGCFPFLAPIKKAEDAVVQVRNWLDTAVYPLPPSTDGSTKKGFRVEVGGHRDALVISPVWIVYGK